MGGFAWVTLATNDSYSLGALVLGHSLRRVNTSHQLVVLITPGVTEAMKTQLSAVFNVVKLVDVLDSRDADNLALLARPELGITFTKLHCWRLTQFDKCVFLDADTLVLQNSDELFEREELSAAPDAGWPDCFNSGVFVYKPSDETYKALIEFALIHGSFDGGDQGLLNLFFSDWPTKDIKKHLPFVYNMCSTATYSYLPAFKQYGQGLKIIHFIGTAKPWLQPFNTETGLATVSGTSQNITQFVQLWWDLFCTNVHPSLSTEMAGLAGALASVTLGAPLSAEQVALEEHLRRQGWEQGHIDYMGKDSFANIWKKICDTLGSSSQLVPSEEPPTPVAPVSAPVYVSSVEISPTGPIDTSPPASYVPVSVPKSTVVSSEVDQAEATTVFPEPKYPSVPELDSTKPTVTSTASLNSSAVTSTVSLDPSAKPSTIVSAVSNVSPAATAPATELSTSASELAIKTEMSSAPIESPLSQSEIPSAIMALDAHPTPALTEVITVPDLTKIQSLPLLETQAGSLPVSQNQASVVGESSTIIVADLIPTKIQPIQTKTDTINSSNVESVTPASSLTSVGALSPDPVVTTPSPVAVETSSVVQLLTETLIPLPTADNTSQLVKDSKKPNTTLESPSVTQNVIEPTIETLDQAPSVEVSQSAPEISVTTSTVSVAAEAVPTTDTVPPIIPENVTTVSSTNPPEPSVEISKIIPVEEKLIKPSQPATELTPPTTPKASLVETPILQKETPVGKEHNSPPSLISTLIQPETPTVTEATPPTSPPTTSVESPLTSKLKVETELPDTPPVGSSSAQPSLVATAEDPPVPPKRKGGAKANQDGKNQKSGKQSKGKK